MVETTKQKRKMPGGPKGPRKPKDFTATQRAALQPYIHALLRRYGEVAAQGETELVNPICVDVPAGHCADCPVFGEKARGGGRWRTDKKTGAEVYVEGPWYHCEDTGFFPLAPTCVEDGTEGVSCGRKPDTVAVFAKGPQKGQPMWPGRLTSRQQAMAWGAEVVARLEALREEAAP